MNKISDIFVSKDDLGKKVYRKVTTYTIEAVSYTHLTLPTIALV